MTQKASGRDGHRSQIFVAQLFKHRAALPLDFKTLVVLIQNSSSAERGLHLPLSVQPLARWSPGLRGGLSVQVAIQGYTQLLQSLCVPDLRDIPSAAMGSKSLLNYSHIIYR